MIKFSSPGLPNEVEALRQSTRQLIGLLKNQRSMWGVAGRRISRHFGERWLPPTADIKSLRPSTLRARKGRTGHYATARGVGPFGNEARSFWWTGKTLEHVMSDASWRATQTALIYDFGTGDLRATASYMHFGDVTRNRPARPLYLDKEVGAIAENTISEYLDVILSGGSVFRVGRA